MWRGGPVTGTIHRIRAGRWESTRSGWRIHARHDGRYAAIAPDGRITLLPDFPSAVTFVWRCEDLAAEEVAHPS